MKQLTLELDDFLEEGYIYTKYDIGGRSHSITIEAKNKEKFLDAFAKECRDRVEGMLKEVKEEE